MDCWRRRERSPRKFAAAPIALYWTVNGLANGTGNRPDMRRRQQSMSAVNPPETICRSTIRLPALSLTQSRHRARHQHRRRDPQRHVADHRNQPRRRKRAALRRNTRATSCPAILRHRTRANNQAVVWQIQGPACALTGPCGAIDADGTNTAPAPPRLQTPSASSPSAPMIRLQSGSANVTIANRREHPRPASRQRLRGAANGFTLRVGRQQFRPRPLRASSVS